MSVWTLSINISFEPDYSIIWYFANPERWVIWRCHCHRRCDRPCNYVHRSVRHCGNFNMVPKKNLIEVGQLFLNLLWTVSTHGKVYLFQEYRFWPLKKPCRKLWTRLYEESDVTRGLTLNTLCIWSMRLKKRRIFELKIERWDWE